MSVMINETNLQSGQNTGVLNGKACCNHQASDGQWCPPMYFAQISSSFLCSFPLFPTLPSDSISFSHVYDISPGVQISGTSLVEIPDLQVTNPTSCARTADTLIVPYVRRWIRHKFCLLWDTEHIILATVDNKETCCHVGIYDCECVCLFVSGFALRTVRNVLYFVNRI